MIKINKLLIKNGKLVSSADGFNFEVKDILVIDGQIAKIDYNIMDENATILDASNMFVAPGFIDTHTHCYEANSPIGTKADLLGVNKGATTIFDAGTAGPLNFEDFRKNHIETSTTDIYSLLNVSDEGLNVLNELISLDAVNYDRIAKVVNGNRDKIKGIKVRASKSVVGDNGIKPIAMAKEISTKLDLPLIVHIGNYPPFIDEVLDLLGKGDIVTHTYHGKVNGIFNEDRTLRDSVIDAKNRGVLFDVGHGSASFNFNVFKDAIKQGLYPNFISTDIYNNNMNGPVHSLLSVINKVMELGIPLEDCIYKVTGYSADIFKLGENYGRIALGANGDFTIFEVEDKKDVVKDSDGNELVLNKKLNLRYTVKTRRNKSEVYTSC